MPPALSPTLIETLPLAERLALSYAPTARREAVLTLLALDNRLARILRQRGEETVIAQIKLAWWRDRLAQHPDSWPEGEPLLALLRRWPGETVRLGPLVDGWEALLAERFGDAERDCFAAGRAAAWRALAEGFGTTAGVAAAAEAAARGWALADLALNLAQGEERAATLAAAHDVAHSAIRLPRTLRPLAVLHGLARRALRRGSDDMLAGPGALVLAMRLGITGR